MDKDGILNRLQIELGNERRRLIPKVNITWEDFDINELYPGADQPHLVATAVYRQSLYTTEENLREAATLLVMKLKHEIYSDIIFMLLDQRKALFESKYEDAFNINSDLLDKVKL